MRGLSNADFLALWERGRKLHALDRGLLAIQVADPDASRESIADWPLGRRNRALVEIRNACFGPALQAWVSCPQCGEKVELKMDCSIFTHQLEGELDKPQQTVEVNGETFRLPTTRDLARIAGETSAEQEPSDEAIVLLKGCRVQGKEGLRQSWSEQEVEEISEKMSAADPLAEILLAFECPVCANSSSETLDLPAFVWSEIEAQVRWLLFEIHTLASAYGWTEQEILSLSDTRRRLYLEMVQA